jgi:hypothetical protein
MVAFLAYWLIVTLKNRLQSLAPGLTPKAVLEPLGAIQMLRLPTADGRWLVKPALHATAAGATMLLHNCTSICPRIKLEHPSRP